jgi:ribosomal protein S21
MNVQVAVRNGDVAQAIRRWRKKCELVLSDARRTEFYRKPSVKHRLKSLRARKRARKVAGLFG